VGELVSLGEKGLMSLRNFGQKSRQEIEERLNELGLSLKPPVIQEEEPDSGEEEASTEATADEAGVLSGVEEPSEVGGGPDEE
jgi:DNA-directed RNA polymerase subunit alpha